MRIGIDIGGSHIGVGLVNENGIIIAKKEKDFSKEDKQNIKKEIEQIIITFIKELLEENNMTIKQIEKIGIASPGVIEDNIIYRANNLNIQEFDLAQILQNYFSIHILIQNDGKCAAMCEKKYGSLKEFSDCIFLCLGTGIGSAVFIDGKLIKANELGHMIIQKHGIPCSCGKNGCFERYASMRALKNKLIKEWNLPEDTSGEELLKYLKKQQNEENIKNILDEYVDNLSIGLSNLIDIFEPEAISLGGSFIHYKDILLDKLVEKLKKENITFNRKVPEILLSQTKNDAGIIGATIF